MSALRNRSMSWFSVLDHLVGESDPLFSRAACIVVSSSSLMTAVGLEDKGTPYRGSQTCLGASPHVTVAPPLSSRFTMMSSSSFNHRGARLCPGAAGFGSQRTGGTAVPETVCVSSCRFLPSLLLSKGWLEVEGRDPERVLLFLFFS